MLPDQEHRVPYQISTLDLPCGEKFIRAEGYGVIAKADAANLLDRVTPGGDLFGLPQLMLTQKVESTTPEARKVFGDANAERDQTTWCAVVVTNPLIRVTANLVARVNKVTRVKLFTSESDALRWLDERAREDAATKKAPGAS
jgi:hypothetical protein